MIKKLVFIGVTIGLVLGVIFITQPVTAEETVTIVGTINGYYQIIDDDGNVFIIGETDKGAELEMYEGKRVEVFGSLVESEDNLVILVIDYAVEETED